MTNTEQETQKSNYPIRARKITIACSGRVLIIKEPTMEVQRMAADASQKGGEFKPLKFAEEFFKMLIIEIRRVNGEKIEIHNPDKIFTEILTYNETQELFTNFDEVLGIEKKVPKVEVL